MAPDGIGLGNGNFYVDNNGTLNTKGNVFMMNNSGEPLLSLENGSIKLSGSITWDANSSPTLVLYGEDSYEVDNPNYADAPEYSSGVWHKNCSASDLYAIYSYDGGNTWTPYPIRFRGEQGQPGEPGKNGTEINDEDLFNILTNNGTDTGIFPFATGNGEDKLYINADYIKSGTIAADHISTEIGQVNKILNIGTYDNIDETKAIWFNSGAKITTISGMIGGQTGLKISASLIKLGSKVDFTDATVTGLKITFG
jgi:hypothetical protein